MLDEVEGKVGLDIVRAGDFSWQFRCRKWGRVGFGEDWGLVGRFGRGKGRNLR